MIAKKSERMRSLFFGDVLMDVAFVGSKGPYQASGTAESGELGRVGGGGGGFYYVSVFEMNTIEQQEAKRVSC